jgi:hypothetical protein
MCNFGHLDRRNVTGYFNLPDVTDDISVLKIKKIFFGISTSDKCKLTIPKF